MDWVQGSEQAFAKAWSGRWRVAGTMLFCSFIGGCVLCGGLAMLLDRTIGLPSMPGRWVMVAGFLAVLPVVVTALVVALRLSGRPQGMIAARCAWPGVLLRYQEDIHHYDDPDIYTPADWIAWPIGLRRMIAIPCYVQRKLYVADLAIDGMYIRLIGVRPPNYPDEYDTASGDPSISYDAAARMLTISYG